MIENLRTPKELLDMFPNCGYNNREIGYLLMLGVVKGKKTKFSCLIDFESFQELLLFIEKNGQKKAVLTPAK